jgi:signal transduction histidine kinase/PAS domain-containing protein
VRAGHPSRFETWRRRKDGTLIPLEISLTPIKDEEGEVVARFSIYWDIRERKRSEERVHRITRSLRMLSDCNQALLRARVETELLNEICRIVVEKGGYLLAWVGYAEDDPEKTIRPVASHGKGADYPRKTRFSWADNLWGQGPAGIAIRTGRMVNIPDIKKDSRFLPWQALAREHGFQSCMAFPLHTDQGVLGALTVYSGETDTFDQKEIEILNENAEDLAYGVNALRKDREREAFLRQLTTFHEIAGKLNESLALDEVLRLIAESAREILHVALAAIFMVEDGRIYLRAESPEGAGAAFRPPAVGEGLIGHIISKGEMVYSSRLNGEDDWLNGAWSRSRGVNSMLALPLQDGERILGVLGLFTPEDRKYTGDELRLIFSFVQYASIAIKNAEAHSKLEKAFQDLERSQKLLIRSEKLSSIGTLAAGAAHEILNPTNIIGMYAQRLREESPEGHPAHGTAEVMLRNVTRIVKICDDLRRFSRNEKPRFQPFDPNETLRTSYGLLVRQMELANIALKESLCPGPIRVMGDEHQMEQVFFNLIKNAMEAMPGGGQLAIASHVAPEQEGWWECRVADTGVGIPKNVLEKIFDPFFTTKPADKGTGLGLAVSHGIVEGHGGQLWAESQPGQGTTFHVRLPLAEDEPAPRNGA